MAAISYLRDGAEIYDLSFARARAAADVSRFDAETAEIIIRMIHACGMPDIADDIAVSGDDVAGEAVAALRGGGHILCDARMVAAGITARFLPAQNRIITTLDDKRIDEVAMRFATTRSAAAVELWREDGLLGGAVIAIGNAPTALFHLLEILDAARDAPRPALIVGLPVGFVGAAESKTLLAEMQPCPFITLHGRRGGSAIAAAAVNALALIAGRKD